jgi:hypothetical protein
MYWSPLDSPPLEEVRTLQVAGRKFSDLFSGVCLWADQTLKKRARDHLLARLHIPAGILRIPVFSVPVALFPQESGFLFRRNFFFTPSGILSVPGLRT